MDEKTIYKNRWLILLSVVLMIFMACLDSSIVNVALPVISKKFSVTMADIEWVVTSYLIVISATILIFGRLGDIKGKTKVFKFGIVLFTFGSLLCGLSNGLLTLVVSRVIQAIGAAAFMSTNQGIVTHVFPPNERGRALGLSGTFVALGTMVGPPLGGFIVSVFSWKVIFLINVPIGIINFILGMRLLPTSNKISTEKLDRFGSILFPTIIILLFGALIKGQVVGYTNIFIILAFIVTAILLVIFIVIEKHLSMPLLHLELFENKLFSISVFCSLISFVAISCSTIIQPFYLQDVMHLSPAKTGLYMTIYPIVLSIIAPLSGHLSDKIGSEILTFIGLIFTSLGLFLMSTLTEHSNLNLMIVFIIIMSLGNGMFQSPNTSLVMSTVPKNKLGIAGSINALVRNIGMVFGVSLSTTLLYSCMSYKIGYHVVNHVANRGDVFVFGMHYVYITAGLICLSGAIITGIRVFRRKIATTSF